MNAVEFKKGGGDPRQFRKLPVSCIILSLLCVCRPLTHRVDEQCHKQQKNDHNG